MKVDWQLIFVEKKQNELTRDEICESLLREGYCADRAGGMKCIALGIRTRDIEYAHSDKSKLVLAAAKLEAAHYQQGIQPIQPQTLGQLLKQNKPRELANVATERKELVPKSLASEDEVYSSLSAEQNIVVHLVEHGENVFFSGSAGVGKSYLLRFLVARETKRRNGSNKVVCTSLTGLASCNIDGITIFSFAGIGLGNEDTSVLLKQVFENRAAIRRWRSVELLFIDEVSMLDASLLEKLEEIARVVRNCSLPFGGIQICLSGDFYQIPPVGLGRDLNIRFCFESSLWNMIVSKNVLLTTVFRQKEQQLIEFLNNFRRGNVDMDMIKMLSNKKRACLQRNMRPSSSSQNLTVEPTTLFARNVDVDRINNQRLTSLGTPQRTFHAYDWHRDPEQAKSLSNYMNTPSAVTLAVGAQVILTKNVSSEIGLVNGSRGVVIGFERMSGNEQRSSSELYARSDPNELLPVVQFASKLTPRVIGRVEFEVFEDNGKTKTFSRCAIPLRLAWALSIHKSQGQTIDVLDVDLSGVFDYGQAFVALSRASTLEGLYITGYREGLPLAHPKVVQFYGELEHKLETFTHPPVANSRLKRQCAEVVEENITWMKKPKRTMDKKDDL